MGALWEPEKENERGIGAMNTALCTWLFVLFCFFTLSPLFSSSFSSLSLIFCPCTVFFFCFRYMLPFVFFFSFFFLARLQRASMYDHFFFSKKKKKKERRYQNVHAEASRTQTNKQTTTTTTDDICELSSVLQWCKPRATCFFIITVMSNSSVCCELCLFRCLSSKRPCIACLFFFFFAGWNPCVHRKAEEKKKQLFITQCKNTRTQANRL